MPFSTLTRVAVTAWLAAMAWIDFRTRELPHWGTTAPLMGVAGYHTVRAVLAWASSTIWSPAVADGLAAGLAFLAVLLSDRWRALLPAAGALGLAFAQGGAAGQTVAVTWLGAVALTRANVLGAGDAKLAMVLAGLFPDPRLAWLMVIAGVVVGGLYLLVRHGPGAIFLVWETTRNLVRLRLPSEEDLARGQPMAVVAALAGVVYVWLLC